MFKTNLEKVISYLVKLLIFFLPIFWLPFTYEFFEFNKEILIWILCPLLFLFWMWGAVDKGKLKIKRTPLDIPVLVFLLISLFSSLFSPHIYSSIFGSYGRSSFAWLGFCACAFFYFILVNFAEKDRLNPFGLLKILIYSYCVAFASSVLAIAGVFRKISGAMSILSSPSFSFYGGTFIDFALFSSIIAILIIGIIFFYRPHLGKSENILFHAILLCSSSFSILVVPKLFFLYLLIIAIVIYFKSKESISFKQKIKKIVLPSIILSVLSFLSLYSFAVIKIQEPRIDLHSNLEIINSMGKKVMMGNGNGSFPHIFSLFRPNEFNQSEFWQVRFDRSYSFVLEILSSCGIVGLLSYALFFSVLISFLFVYLRRLRKSPELLDPEKESALIPVLYFALFALFIEQFFFNFNIILIWLVFFFSALLSITLRHSSFDKLFKTAFLKKEIVLPAFFILTACWLALTSLGIKNWVADYYFRKGGEDGLLKAANLNKARAEYDIALAKYYLLKSKFLASKSAGENSSDQIKVSIQDGLRWANMAVRTNPDSVSGYEILGMIYRDTRSLTKGSEELTINAFSNALALEPSNPVLVTELAKAYYNSGNLEKSEELLSRALYLKPDYFDAQFGLSRIYAKRGDESIAIRYLENLIKKYPREEYIYEYGRLLYNEGKIDQAMKQFLKVSEMNPANSNAFYSLGLAYESKKQNKEALDYYNKALALNPGNEEIKSRIEKIK